MFLFGKFYEIYSYQSYCVKSNIEHKLFLCWKEDELTKKSQLIYVWTLQGSSDGKNWTNLRVHESDQTLSKPGQFASWSVTGPNALIPFRYFRVTLTSPTTDDINPWTLCICFLELYGYFHWIIIPDTYVVTRKTLLLLQYLCTFSCNFELMLEYNVCQPV